MYKHRLSGRSIAVFLGVSLAVFIIDQVTKALAGSYDAGQVIGGPYLGLFELRLVHNVGGAWGIFAGSTLALAIVAAVVCIAVLVYFFRFANDPSTLMTVGLALIFAGGFGNMIDRVFRGYVVDFIDLTFVDFPVFNIADIGVTCGFAVVIVSLLLDRRHAQ